MIKRVGVKDRGGELVELLLVMLYFMFIFILNDNLFFIKNWFFYGIFIL